MARNNHWRQVDRPLLSKLIGSVIFWALCNHSDANHERILSYRIGTTAIWSRGQKRIYFDAALFQIPSPFWTAIFKYLCLPTGLSGYECDWKITTCL